VAASIGMTKPTITQYEWKGRKLRHLPTGRQWLLAMISKVETEAFCCARTTGPRLQSHVEMVKS
jgi:hypothetical protein